MAASFMYSVFTAFGVCLIGVGLALQILYIENHINDDNNYLPHQLASIAINTLVVCYLLFTIMFYRPYSSPLSMGAALIGLLGGLAIEITTSQWAETPAIQGLSYTFAGINALIRLYILISVRCDQYLTTIPNLVNQIVKQSKETGQSVDKVVSTVSTELKSQGEQLSTVDPMRLYQNVMSNLGSVISDLPEDKKNAARDAVRKAVGAPPRNTQGGRKR